MRFLVVDDSRAVQAIIRRTLSSHGFPDLDIKVAGDGQEALDLIEHWKPDLIISDWHMPTMDGMQLLVTLRKHHPQMKLGFVTTEFEEDRIKLAMETGACFIVQKPFQNATLIDAVNAALSNKFIGNDNTVAPREDTLLVVPMNVDGITALIAGIFGAGTFVIRQLPEVDADAIDLPCGVGVYSHVSTKSIHGLCLIDHAGMLLLGGSIGKMTFPAIEALMMSNNVPPAQWKGVAQFLEKDVSRMFLASDKGDLTLMKSQVVTSSPPQLIGIMKRSSSRSDFSISRATLPEGRLTLIAK